MNRLTPLISRRSGSLVARAAALDVATTRDAPSTLLDDLKLFAAAWAGGMIFFTTYLS